MLKTGESWESTEYCVRERGIVGDIENCGALMRKTRLLKEVQRNPGKEQRIMGKQSIMKDTGFMKKQNCRKDKERCERQGLHEA